MRLANHLGTRTLKNAVSLALLPSSRWANFSPVCISRTCLFLGLCLTNSSDIPARGERFPHVLDSKRPQILLCGRKHSKNAELSTASRHSRLGTEPSSPADNICPFRFTQSKPTLALHESTQSYITHKLNWKHFQE